MSHTDTSVSVDTHTQKKQLLGPNFLHLIGTSSFNGVSPSKQERSSGLTPNIERSAFLTLLSSHLNTHLSIQTASHERHRGPKMLSTLPQATFSSFQRKFRLVVAVIRVGCNNHAGKNV